MAYVVENIHMFLNDIVIERFKIFSFALCRANANHKQNKLD